MIKRHERVTLTVEELRTGDIVKRRGTAELLRVGSITMNKTSYNVEFWSLNGERLVRVDWVFSGSKMDVRPGCWNCANDRHADCGVCGRQS